MAAARWGAGVVTGIFCGDLQFFAACFHARNRGLCLITMTGAVPLLGNRTEGRTTVERHSQKLLLSSITIAISLHHLSGRRHLISRCTVLGMSKMNYKSLKISCAHYSENNKQCQFDLEVKGTNLTKKVNNTAYVQGVLH